MQRSISLISATLLTTLIFTAGSVAAKGPEDAAKTMTQQQTTAGEQIQNLGDESQLRNRINENDPDQAKKVRAEEQTQKAKKSKNQYKYQEKAPGQHMNQSGMGGMGGGGGRH